MSKKFNFDLTGKKKAEKHRKIGLAKGLAIGAAAGSAFGAISGILFAPKSGKETREQIGETAKKTAVNVKDAASKTASELKEKTGEVNTFINSKLKKNCCQNEEVQESIKANENTEE